MATKISCAPNGPILVSGDFELIGSDQQPIAVNKPQIALCRCGGSKNKPFCDGTHRSINFCDKAAAQNAQHP